MRKIIFGGANSLDNYFARKDNSVDWLMWSDEAQALMAEFWDRFDTILMGRKTYEVAVSRSQGGESDGDTGFKTYVFSRTLKEIAGKSSEIVSENAVEFVRDLKARDGKDICLMGGGNLAKTFFEAGLIDEIGFNIHPVLLGSGIPLFYEMNRQVDLELIECKPFKNGCVYVLYRVKT
ncbi:MAG: dihydrofolate reductase family protein [Pyrinomonadaceae bacterium]